MATKTNTGLVEYAKAQLGKPYWYGTFGLRATKELYQSKKKQYPERYTATDFPSQYGQRVHDCVGLIKGYLWSDTSTSKPKYNSAQDVSANGMKDVCKEKGPISTMPNIPGVLVFMNQHVGVYIGGGYVIEAKGHAYGVVKTKLEGRGWKYWGKCPWITYSTTTTKPATTTTTNPKQPTTTTPTTGNTVPTATSKYYKAYTGESISLVDALKAIGVDSSYANRKKIAKANGISAYVGSAKQNTKLLNLLKAGKLLKY